MIHPSFSASYNQWSRSQEGRVFTSLQFSDQACYLIYVCHLAWCAPQIYKLEHAGNDRIDLVASTCHASLGHRSSPAISTSFLTYLFFPLLRAGEQQRVKDRPTQPCMHLDCLMLTQRAARSHARYILRT